METTRITLTVNGERFELEVPNHRRLVELLKEDLHLASVKTSCGSGESMSTRATAVTLPPSLPLLPASQPGGGGSKLPGSSANTTSATRMPRERRNERRPAT